MLGRGSSWSHQNYPVLQNSSSVSLTLKVTKLQNIIILGKVRSRRSITLSILKHGNPFAVEGDKLHNVITHAYIPDEYVGLQAILNADATGQKLYEDYVSERINGDVSLWAPVKKENNKMFRSANKKTTIKLRDKTVDLKETKDLYGRLMVLARSSRDINQKEAIGNYEFTLTPRALFAPDGTILRCMDKSKLIHLLNKLTTTQPLPQDDELPEDGMDTTQNVPSRKIALVDGMVLLQQMAKNQRP